MNEFYTILTAVGRNKLASATANGSTIKLTQFRLGDGNGASYNPTETQTSLRREVWRGNVTLTKVDSNNPNWIVVEVDVPATDGGFMIREAGVFDSAGDLIAISKYPETYKPLVDQGSAKELKVRMIIEVSNASSVTLNINPGVILVSQQGLKDAIDDIKIGGRNFILNSSWIGGDFRHWSDSSYAKSIEGPRSGTYGITYTRTDREDATARTSLHQLRREREIELELDTDYTLSGWYRVNSEVSLQHDDNDISVRIRYDDTDTISDLWRRRIRLTDPLDTWIYFSVTANTGSRPAHIENFRFALDRNGSVSLSQLKFEKGDRATDWSPDPEDFPTEKILWSGSISAEGTEITIVDGVESYTYLKFYGRFFAGSGEYLLGEHIASRSTYVIRDKNLSDNIDDPGLEISESTLRREGRTIRIDQNQVWRWSGNATANASKQNTSNITVITRIVGVRT